jgi:hypothetical protein
VIVFRLQFLASLFFNTTFHSPRITLRTFLPFPLSRPFFPTFLTTFPHSNPTYNSMRLRDTPFPFHCPLLPLHPCDATEPFQQRLEPTTLPWREITEIWLIWGGCCAGGHLGTRRPLASRVFQVADERKCLNIRMSIVEFSESELEEFIVSSESRVRVQRLVRHMSLLPKYLSDTKSAINNTLNAFQNVFDIT